jgi:hypothetical protein
MNFPFGFKCHHQDDMSEHDNFLNRKLPPHFLIVDDIGEPFVQIVNLILI